MPESRVAGSAVLFPVFDAEDTARMRPLPLAEVRPRDLVKRHGAQVESASLTVHTFDAHVPNRESAGMGPRRESIRAKGRRQSITSGAVGSARA